MNIEEKVEIGCMAFWMLFLCPLVAGAALGAMAQGGMLPELQVFIESGDAEKMARGAGHLLGILIGVGLGLGIASWLVKQVDR